MHDRVERDQARQRAIAVRQREHVGDLKAQRGTQRPRLLDHRRRQIGALDARVVRCEDLRHLARSAPDLDDQARASLRERREERAIERFACELVGELLAVPPRDRSVPVAHLVSARIAH